MKICLKSLFLVLWSLAQFYRNISVPCRQMSTLQTETRVWYLTVTFCLKNKLQKSIMFLSIEEHLKNLVFSLSRRSLMLVFHLGSSVVIHRILRFKAPPADFNQHCAGCFNSWFRTEGDPFSGRGPSALNSLSEDLKLKLFIHFSFYFQHPLSVMLIQKL